MIKSSHLQGVGGIRAALPQGGVQTLGRRMVKRLFCCGAKDALPYCAPIVGRKGAERGAALRAAVGRGLGVNDDEGIPEGGRGRERGRIVAPD